jgi:hypothetical protein
MKRNLFLLGAGLVALLAGCSSTPVALAPVGPNPYGVESKSIDGQLQVFTRLALQNDDQEQGGQDNGSPAWYQHTGYTIYNMDGTRVKHVGNTSGHYDQTPRPIALLPGKYLVKARSKDYLEVIVPVVIQSGRTTRVHLDDKWKPAFETPETQLVTLPDGNLVGWRVGSTNSNDHVTD